MKDDKSEYRHFWRDLVKDLWREIVSLVFLIVVLVVLVVSVRALHG